MNDMSSVIVPKSDQISADDFISGPQTFVIESVSINPGTEQPVSIKLAGEARAFRPCKSMSRVMVAGWGPDANLYKGRSLTLYRDPKVKWGGMEVGGIRISHMSHIERDMIMSLTATKGKRSPYQVKVLATEQPREELTVAEAELHLREADDMDTLRNVWSRKAMAPLREQLQAVLDECKAKFTAADPE